MRVIKNFIIGLLFCINWCFQVGGIILILFVVVFGAFGGFYLMCTGHYIIGTIEVILFYGIFNYKNHDE